MFKKMRIADQIKDKIVRARLRCVAS